MPMCFMPFLPFAAASLSHLVSAAVFPSEKNEGKNCLMFRCLMRSPHFKNQGRIWMKIFCHNWSTYKTEPNCPLSANLQHKLLRLLHETELGTAGCSSVDYSTWLPGPFFLVLCACSMLHISGMLVQ